MQKRAIESVMSKMTYYLDQRYQQIRRVNPKVEAIWEDVLWQQMTSLRISVSGDKSFGPVRFHVAELMLGDDTKRVRELFSLKSQASLLGEIVESKESDGHKTHGALEIHDNRSLAQFVDPSTSGVIVLIQTFIWWDLEDASDWARFDSKAALINAFEQNGITPEMADYYKEVMAIDRKPTAEDVIIHECKMMKRTLEQFRFRRGVEPAYQMIVKRDPAATENPDQIIEAVAQQLNLLKNLRAGHPLDPNVAEQFARALGTEAAHVTQEKAIAFLDNMVQGNKKRLKASLSGVGTGAPYNLKRSQLDEFDKKYLESIKGRKVDETPA